MVEGDTLDMLGVETAAVVAGPWQLNLPELRREGECDMPQKCHPADMRRGRTRRRTYVDPMSKGLSVVGEKSLLDLLHIDLEEAEMHQS